MSDKPKPDPTAGKGPQRAAGIASGAVGADAAKLNAQERFDFLLPPQKKGELGRLAHYRVLKVLGKGGMGVVFQAEDTRLHRTVGLKVMLPAVAKKQLARDRFMREARATAKIEHDHIVTIFDVNEDRGVPYLAMQYLKGATLEDFLKRGKVLTTLQILRIGKEIAKGLAAAHAQQLIHRDIKPSNIWLDSTNKGRVKILDFGLARPTNAETQLTQIGTVLGSPAYMSPEQAFGQPLDGRCDLFSLGCVLYRLCGGRLPFMGKDATAVLLAITSAEPIPIAELNPETPRSLADLIHQLLAKSPDDRPASAKAVVQRIQEIERVLIAQSKTAPMQALRPPLSPAPTSSKSTSNADEYDVEPVPDESAIIDLDLQASDPPGLREKPRGRIWLVAGLCGALATVFAVLGCLGVALALDHGYVNVIAEDDRAQTFLAETGVIVWDHHKKPHHLSEGLNKLPTGGYQLDAGELPSGIIVEPGAFSLHWRETTDLRVRSKRQRPAIVAINAEQARKLQEEWSAYLERPIVDSLTADLNLVLIPPGEFEMGSPKDATAQQFAELKGKYKKDKLPPQYNVILESESPRHPARITRPFYLGACEVRHGQFAEFVRSEKYVTLPEQDKKGASGIDNGVIVRKPEFTWKNTGFKQTADHPACNIAWRDAEAFCAWLSKRTNRVCRLPTEAEWEYACRAGSTSAWSFGDDLTAVRRADYMWFHLLPKTATLTSTHPVAKKAANGFGLFDMHGNVAEMCKDWWARDYYDRSPKVDPQGPSPDPKLTQRVARGGSFADMPFLCRSASRSPLDPAQGYVNVGFRIVCEIPQAGD